MTKILAEGQITDWGLFAGGGAGYTIGVGTESDVLKCTKQFAPYAKTHIQTVLSIDEVAKGVKSMAG